MTLVRWLWQRARPLVDYIAWHHPRLYLWLMVSLGLNRNPYFKLVRESSILANDLPSPESIYRSAKEVQPKNILYAIHWYELGGAESYALYTIMTASAMGHRCHCVSTVPSANPELGVFSRFCKEARAFESSKAGMEFEHFLLTYIEEHEIDVLHIHHSALAYESLDAVKRSFPSLRIVDSTHIVEYGSGGYPNLSARYSPQIDCHNVISRNLVQVQQTLYRDFHGGELEIGKFHLGYLSSLAPKPPGDIVAPLAGPRRTVTFYGRLVVQKQPNLFMKVMERIMEKYPDLPLEVNIFGDGDWRAALKSRIASSRQPDRFRFHGRCDDKRVVFEPTDLLFLSSLNEGIALTAYEALKFGRLVVSSDVGAQSELLCEECRVPLTTGFIEAAADRIYQLLSDGEMYADVLEKNLNNLELIRNFEASPATINRLYLDLP